MKRQAGPQSPTLPRVQRGVETLRVPMPGRNCGGLAGSVVGRLGIERVWRPTGYIESIDARGAPQYTTQSGHTKSSHGDVGRGFGCQGWRVALGLA